MSRNDKYHGDEYDFLPTEEDWRMRDEALVEEREKLKLDRELQDERAFDLQRWAWLCR